MNTFKMKNELDEIKTLAITGEIKIVV